MGPDVVLFGQPVPTGSVLSSVVIVVLAAGSCSVVAAAAAAADVADVIAAFADVFPGISRNQSYHLSC